MPPETPGYLHSVALNGSQTYDTIVGLHMCVLPCSLTSKRIVL